MNIYHTHNDYEDVLFLVALARWTIVYRSKFHGYRHAHTYTQLILS